jgi:hypothetical protein
MATGEASGLWFPLRGIWRPGTVAVGKVFAAGGRATTQPDAVRRYIAYRQEEVDSIAPRGLEEGGACHARDEARNFAVGRIG